MWTGLLSKVQRKPIIKDGRSWVVRRPSGGSRQTEEWIGAWSPTSLHTEPLCFPDSKPSSADEPQETRAGSSLAQTGSRVGC